MSIIPSSYQQSIYLLSACHLGKKKAFSRVSITTNAPNSTAQIYTLSCRQKWRKRTKTNFSTFISVKIFAHQLVTFKGSIARAAFCQPGAITHTYTVHEGCKQVKRSHRKHLYLFWDRTASVPSWCSSASMVLILYIITVAATSNVTQSRAYERYA